MMKEKFLLVDSCYPTFSQLKEIKYYIDTSDNWNDYGYKTLCKLYKVINEESLISIGTLKCFNSSGQTGVRFSLINSYPRAFIMDYNTAYRMIFYMSVEDRRKLIDALNLGRLFSGDKNTNIFKSSILRNWSSFEEFKEFNDKIMLIIQTEVDVSKLVKSEISSINKFAGK